MCLKKIGFAVRMVHRAPSATAIFAGFGFTTVKSKSRIGPGSQNDLNAFSITGITQKTERNVVVLTARRCR